MPDRQRPAPAGRENVPGEASSGRCADAAVRKPL